MKSISELAIKNRNLVWFILAMCILGGISSFITLGKKEDSTFVIKSAMLVCRYAGATPLEVEQLITEPIEREVQSMRNIYKITSDSHYGLSKIFVELDPATPASETPQLWDELRRKVLNIKSQLPSGASDIVVGDDFGDLYGLYYAISADEGFSYSELRDWAQLIKTRIVSIEGVQKVALWGEREPVVNIYVSLSALSNFSIRPELILATIGKQNSVVSSGEKQAGEMEIRIVEDGGYQSLDDIANQLLMSSDGKQYRLGDVAQIEMEYLDPPTSIMRVDSKRAIGVGVSTSADADVVKIGNNVSKALDDIKASIPLGISLEVLYPEDEIAREATNTFLVNLAQSLAIVIVLIMLAMGLRAGFLIGSSLIFSIGGTLLMMQFVGEGLNRTSLAGFIIAMGMLVDNAIVVTDNAQNLISQGVARRKALINGANATKWSLLGATFIAIFSFLPLYLAPSAVAEIVKPLFVVVAISLLFSWALALTQTPMFGDFILSSSTKGLSPQSGGILRFFDRFLALLLRHRWWVVVGVVGLFFASLKVMSSMPQNFFPSLDKPYFRADVILPDGYNINSTEEAMSQMESWLLRQKEVSKVSSTVGGAPPRYYIASGATSLTPNFGNILIELQNSKQTAVVEARFDKYVTDSIPDVWLRSSLFKLSPVPDATIEFGFIGDNIDTLLMLTSKVQDIMWQNPKAINIRNSWGNRVPTWTPRYSQSKGQRIGISRSDLATGLTIATTGYPLGVYRRGDQFLPILLRDADISDYNLSSLQTLPLFSPAGKLFSVEQAVSEFVTENRLGVIERYNRQRVMKAQCDPAKGVNTKQLYTEILGDINSSVPISKGYQLKVFGEEESQVESNEALAKNFPLTMVLIFIVLLLLFGNYRDPIIILLMIPLIFIGVVVGLAVSGRMFDFFALLGVLGLVGMNIKNGVVLVAQIGEFRALGKDPYSSIIEATRARVIPVVVASGTTILGMIPLLFDSLFGAMAATIMGGLAVATILTICVLPVCYAIFYSVKP